MGIEGLVYRNKFIKEKNKRLSELGIKDEHAYYIVNFMNDGWNIGEPSSPRRTGAEEPIQDDGWNLGVRPRTVKNEIKNAPRKRGSDGYLLPENWRCMVCKANNKDKRASSSVRVGMFVMVIKDDSCFQDLGQAEKKTIRINTQQISDPLGGVKARPAGTEHFKDTAGLAHDNTGVGFDAVFLCDTHAGVMRKAIEILAKNGSK